MKLFLWYALATSSLWAQAVSSLYSRGYTLIPQPQKEQLKDADFAFDGAWRIVPGAGVAAGDVALETLKQELGETQ